MLYGHLHFSLDKTKTVSLENSSIFLTAYICTYNDMWLPCLEFIISCYELPCFITIITWLHYPLLLHSLYYIIIIFRKTWIFFISQIKKRNVFFYLMSYFFHFTFLSYPTLFYVFNFHTTILYDKPVKDERLILVC